MCEKNAPHCCLRAHLQKNRQDETVIQPYDSAKT